MKVINVIEDEDVIKKILQHLGLWQIKPRPPPKATCLRAATCPRVARRRAHRQAGPIKIAEYSIDYSTTQLPDSDKWLYVDPEPAYT
jgi:hypothetical protein